MAYISTRVFLVLQFSELVHFDEHERLNYITSMTYKSHAIFILIMSTSVQLPTGVFLGRVCCTRNRTILYVLTQASSTYGIPKRTYVVGCTKSIAR